MFHSFGGTIDLFAKSFPANIYLFKVNNRNTWKRSEICSKLTIKTLDLLQWHHWQIGVLKLTQNVFRITIKKPSIFIVDFQDISYLFQVFLLLTLNRLVFSRQPNEANIYLFRVNNRKVRKRFQKCSKLAIKLPERRHWRRSGVCIVNFEHISYLFLVFLVSLQLTIDTFSVTFSTLI